jgi:O-antigen/teichoic acid export membrane protein
MIPAKLWRWSRYGSIGALIPGWNLAVVLPMLKFCISVLVVVVFGMLAEALRPVILGMRISTNAGRALADYQIINYVRMLLLMIVTTLMTTLVPHISGAAAGGNMLVYKQTIVQGTKYSWWICGLLGFGAIMLAGEFICVYVGSDSLYLKPWLIILISGVLYNLYVTPIVCVILSSGKMSPMIYATAAGCLGSLGCCWFLAPQYGVGAIAVALVVYNVIHLVVMHSWYLPKYFGVDPVHQIGKIMLPPILAGLSMCVSVRWFVNLLGFTNQYMNILIGMVCGTLVYVAIAVCLFVRPAELRKLISRIST